MGATISGAPAEAQRPRSGELLCRLKALCRFGANLGAGGSGGPLVDEPLLDDFPLWVECQLLPSAMSLHLLDALDRVRDLDEDRRPRCELCPSALFNHMTAQLFLQLVVRHPRRLDQLAHSNPNARVRRDLN